MNELHGVANRLCWAKRRCMDTMVVSDQAMPPQAGRRAARFSWQFCMTSLPWLTGCDRAPSQNILGSFFPSWILCAAAGIVLAIACRAILVAARLDKYLFAPPLAYLSLAAAGTVFTWLYRFGQ
jgi:hypothetical protein